MVAAAVAAAMEVDREREPEVRRLGLHVAGKGSTYTHLCVYDVHTHGFSPLRSTKSLKKLDEYIGHRPKKKKNGISKVFQRLYVFHLYAQRNALVKHSTNTVSYLQSNHFVFFSTSGFCLLGGSV